LFQNLISVQHFKTMHVRTRMYICTYMCMRFLWQWKLYCGLLGYNTM